MTAWEEKLQFHVIIDAGERQIMVVYFISMQSEQVTITFRWILSPDEQLGVTMLKAKHDLVLID